MSKQSAILGKLQVEVISKNFGCETEASRGHENVHLSRLAALSYSGDMSSQSYSRALEEFWDHDCVGKYSWYLCAQTQSEEVNFSTLLTKRVIRGLCRVLRDPVFHTRGKFEVRPSSETVDWHWRTACSIDKCFPLQDALALLEEKQGYDVRLFLGTIPNWLVEPQGAKIIRVSVEFSVVEWSQDVELGLELGADDVMKKLVETVEREDTKDFIIMAENGAEIKCHSMILAGENKNIPISFVHSAVFSAMLSSSDGMKEGQTRRVEWKDVSEEGAKSFVQYLYGGKISSDINCEVALELLQIAHKYGVARLEEALQNLFIRNENQIGWFTPDVVLELYFFVKNLDGMENLQEASLRVMIGRLEEVRVAERFKELGATEKEDLLWKLLYLK